MTTFNLTCEAVETMLHEYLDETLEPWVRISVEEHLRECARCTALARELRDISREAASLPALVPESDPWPRVAARIGASVIESAPVAEVAPVSPAVAEVAPVTPTPEPIVPAADSPVPMSERSTVAIEPPVWTAESGQVASEPAMVTNEPAMVTSEPAMVTSEPPKRIGEPPVQRDDEPPVLKSDGPPVLAIPVYVLPAPKEESVMQPVQPSRTPQAPKPAPVSAPLGRPREKRWGPGRMGLAAAALVLATAGTTSLLTVQWLGRARTPNVASDTGAPKSSSREKLPTGLGTRSPSVGSHQQVAPGSSTPVPPSGQVASALVASETSAPQVTSSPEDVVYDKQIKVLEKIVRRQKADLDASTVAEIDKNLRALDSAIAQIRAALQKDPRNSLLGDQASRALEMKVELLRRTAMLGSST